MDQKIFSTKLMNLKPKVFGLGFTELFVFIGTVIVLNMLLGDRALVSILSAGGVTATFVYLRDKVRYERAMMWVLIHIVPRNLLKLFKRKESLVWFEIADSQLSEEVFRDSRSTLERITNLFMGLSYDAPLFFRFERRLMPHDTGSLDDKSLDESFILFAKDDEAKLNFGQFVNLLYVACSLSEAKKIGRLFQESGFRLKSFDGNFSSEIYGVGEGPRLVSNEKESRTAVLGDLPNEFFLKDWSYVLRAPCEVIFSQWIKKRKNGPEVKRMARNHHVKSTLGGGVDSQISSAVSNNTTEDVLMSVIRGEEALFETESYITYLVSQTTRDLVESLPTPLLFEECFKDLNPLRDDLVRGLHRGELRLEGAIRNRTGREVAALSGIPFVHHAPKDRANFLTECAEGINITGFQQDALPNGNGCVFGPSGKGKSFLMGYMCQEVLRQPDTRAVILDCGYSFQNLCRAFDGEVFEMSAEGDGYGFSIIDLLKGIESPQLRSELLVSFTQFLGGALVGPQEVAMLQDLSIRFEELNSFLDWHNLLKANGLSHVAITLKPFCKGGLYGNHFDGDGFDLERIKRANFIYFTGPTITNAKASPLFVPYFFVANLLISQFSKDRSKRSFILWDEISYLMEHASSLVSNLWTCMRKTGSSVYCCAQNTTQLIEESRKGAANIVNNSPTRVLLGLDMETKDLDGILRLSAGERSRLNSRRAGEPFFLSQENKSYWISFVTSQMSEALFRTDTGHLREFNNAKERVIQKLKEKGADEPEHGSFVTLFAVEVMNHETI